MTNRKGAFLGAYLDPGIKEDLQRAAAANHRTLSREVERRLSISLYGTSAAAASEMETGGDRSTRARSRPVPGATEPQSRPTRAPLPCSEGYSRHRFHRRRGGRALKRCVRCRRPKAIIHQP